MKHKTPIETNTAPSAIGTYSQAIKTGNLLFISGQIALSPTSTELVSDDFTIQAKQVLDNISAICKAANADINQVVKFMVYLTDLSDFALLNEQMEKTISLPYPARAAVEVSKLPKGAKIEIDAIVALTE